MRKGRGYPVVGPVLVALLVSATALLGHGFGPGPSVPACAGGGCESRAVNAFDFFSVASGTGAAQEAEFDADSVEEVLERGLALAEASPVHLAFRGTGAAGSVRCEWRGVARTTEQREAAIRFWLDLEETDALPSASEVERRFMAELERIKPIYPETVKANFRSIAEGGLTPGYTFLACYSDYTVQEYLLGSGPMGSTNLTVAYDRMGEAHSYGLYREAHGMGEFGDELLLSRGEYEAYLSQIASDVELLLGLILEGRESVVFLAPMGAHNAIAVEAWQTVAQWDLQTDDEGVVQAIRYGADENDPEHTQTLANLETRVTTAAAADDFANDRIANVSGLTQYYRDMGAYGDITPDDGSTATFTPGQPPPGMTCATGTAVTNPAVNRGLVHDCQALLSAKDALRGTATLNWAAGTAISSWTGVTTGGTPSRITGLALASQSLDGSIPVELGTLFELTSLDLSSNSLTGAIPHELGWLFNLDTLKLSGNSLTGCIPVALEGVATNDLSSLNLLYCQPPAPGSVSVTPTETTAALGWGAVSNSSKYRVEYRLRGVGEWSVADDTVTGTSLTVHELTCESDYQFRVSAYGSGTTYAAAWSEASAVATGTTTECVSPVFDAAAYEFPIPEDAEIDSTVGAVTATDPNEDTVSYSIAAGNEDGKFSIDGTTGEVTVTGALEYDLASEYTLTVEAEDDDENTGTTTVKITITEAITPSLTLRWLDAPTNNQMDVGDVAWFSVYAENLSAIKSYSIGIETENDGMGLFHDTCFASPATHEIPLGDTSFARPWPLHACAAPGGTVAVTLSVAETVLITATLQVTIVDP